jgi:hypothetical protein
MKNRKREICTSGTVRDEDGNILIYSAAWSDLEPLAMEILLLAWEAPKALRCAQNIHLFAASGGAIDRRFSAAFECVHRRVSKN